MDAERQAENKQREEAIVILSSLAQGRDPGDGGAFPSDSPYNRPEVIRALYFALENLKKIPKSGSRHQDGQRHKPGRWTAEADEELRERYLAGAALPELMQIMERGRTALIGRLKLLGLIDDADHVRD